MWGCGGLKVDPWCAKAAQQNAKSAQQNGVIWATTISPAAYLPVSVKLSFRMTHNKHLGRIRNPASACWPIANEALSW